MFVPLVVEPNEVNILKINQEFLTKEDQVIKSDKSADQAKSGTNKTSEAFVGQETTLSIEGFSPEGDVMMSYTNKA